MLDGFYDVNIISNCYDSQNYGIHVDTTMKVHHTYSLSRKLLIRIVDSVLRSQPIEQIQRFLTAYRSCPTHTLAS